MKKIYLTLLLLCFMFYSGANIFAQAIGSKFYQKTFDQSNGLPENTVSCILQDKFGYIWVSTWDGLARYDGNEFTHFKSTTSDKSCLLPSNRINWITETSYSDIWCIVNQKVYLFRRSSLTFEEVCPKEQLRPIRHICPQANHKSWLVAQDGTAYEVADNHPQKVLRKFKVNLDAENTAVYKASTGDFSFFADTHGNIKFRNLYTLEIGYAKKNPLVNLIYGISKYRNNSVLVSTNHGVYVYETPTKFYPLPGWEKQYMRYLCVDKQGNIWMANYPGLTELCPVKEIITPHKIAIEQKDEFIRALYQDKLGRTWIADKNNFIRIIRDNKTFYLSSNGTLSESRSAFGSNIYCIYEDYLGNFWLGTKRNGLFKLTPSAGKFDITHYPTTTQQFGLNCSSIYAITEDAQHNLWLGTHGGGINKAVFDKQGNAKFLNAKNTFKNYPEGCEKVRCFYSMKNGVMLVGTTNGLVSFSTKEKNPKFFLNQEKLKENSMIGNDVMQIAANKKGEIYLANFGGGVNIITSKQLLSNDLTFKQVNTLNGLASDASLTLAFDSQDNLWTISEMAISKYNRNHTITNFSIRDFGDNFIFSEVQPICIGKQILVGTTQGLLTFSLDKLKKSSFSPAVVINHIFVEGKERLQDFNIKPSLVLEKDERNLIINFSTLDFNRSAPILYKYKVEGLDDDWKVVKNTSLNLANIPAGKYTLEVTSTNGDGMWNCPIRKLSIEVKPKFNETLFAKVLYSILLIALGFFIYIIATYIYRLRAQIEEVQLATNEKIEKISQRIHELMGNKASLEDLHTDVADKIIDKQREFTDKLMEYMNQNIERSELQVGDIAAHMGMSKTLLYTKTKEALNCTPLTLINDLRIKRAVKLLESGNNVSSVAYSCGFSDPHYFSRCFKKAMGCSPSEYANKKED